MGQWLLVGTMLRRMNTWWGRNMVCLSADEFAENLLESKNGRGSRDEMEF